ncbi:MAG: hypothetical protein R3B45_13645 [Bdellovibrionota bacterium]
MFLFWTHRVLDYINVVLMERSYEVDQSRGWQEIDQLPHLLRDLVSSA